jgi:hypothetical protein
VAAADAGDEQVESVQDFGPPLRLSPEAAPATPAGEVPTEQSATATPTPGSPDLAEEFAAFRRAQ